MSEDKEYQLVLLIHKGSSTTTVQSYTPTDQEVRMQKQVADYSEAILPNAYKLNDTAASLLFQNLGDTQVDYNTLLEQAQAQSSAAQEGVANLTQGVLPQSYIDNMTEVVQSGVENSLGDAVNTLANRGVINSSVTDSAINNISTNVANTMAENYLNNISTLNSLYGQQSSLAGNNITLAAAAQEAAQEPALNLWNASLGLGGYSNNALSALSGQGTTTSTSTTSGGSWASGLLGTSTSLGSAALSNSSLTSCFTAETPIMMADLTEKPIEDIQAGDKVLCYNNNDAITIETVKFKAKPILAFTYRVECQDGEKKKIIGTTISQPFLMANKKAKKLADIEEGDELLNVGTVVTIRVQGIRTVFDFQTTGENRYYANGFIAEGAKDEQKPSEEA